MDYHQLKVFRSEIRKRMCRYASNINLGKEIDKNADRLYALQEVLNLVDDLVGKPVFYTTSFSQEE